ncbi:NAC transcription factor 29 [Acorus gramineus]|uniref:NAC transcription factor 29 n=1 Tax=Acorus gramineus TaxID=55184 RepID=A0AAV9A8G6_ACOGR|nr:NAC transcription factor 29 [Acorus gramineus]
MKMDVNAFPGLPPGFRFHPTDEELIMHYLRNQVRSRPCPVSIIPELNIYGFDPWDLPERSDLEEGEWYFFTPLDRKYPNGVRPNRATMSGYWKATGTDKAIYSESRYVGVKKALVFYKGRPPKGVKTDWIMHEYRMRGSDKGPATTSGSMRLDEWVLCRIYKKKHMKRASEEEGEGSGEGYRRQVASRFPRSCSLTHLLEGGYMTTDAQGLEDDPFGLVGLQGMVDGSNSSNSGRFCGNQSYNFVEPVFQF